MSQNYCFKNFKLLVNLLILLLFSPLAILAQYKVTGQVVGFEKQKGLSQSSVTLIPGNFSTQTTNDGSFELTNIPAGNYTITISFIGYASYVEKFELNTDKFFQITLKQKTVDHEEIGSRRVSTRWDSPIGFWLPRH